MEVSTFGLRTGKKEKRRNNLLKGTSWAGVKESFSFHMSLKYMIRVYETYLKKEQKVTNSLSNLLKISSKKRERGQRRFDGRERDKNFKNLFMFAPQRIILF